MSDDIWSDYDTLEQQWFKPISQFEAGLESLKSRLNQPIISSKLGGEIEDLLCQCKGIVKARLYSQDGGWKNARLPKLPFNTIWNIKYLRSTLYRVVESGEAFRPLNQLYDLSSDSASAFSGCMAYFTKVQSTTFNGALLLIGDNGAWNETLKELARRASEVLERPSMFIGPESLNKQEQQLLTQGSWWAEYIFFSLLATKSDLQSRASTLHSNPVDYIRDCFKSAEPTRMLVDQLSTWKCNCPDLRPSPVFEAWLCTAYGSEIEQAVGQLLSHPQEVIK